MGAPQSARYYRAEHQRANRYFLKREDNQDIPRRWRVENSWGDKGGKKGYYLMNDNWFDQYMFEIAARQEYVPDNLLGELEEDPIVLAPWDPMGALAR